VATCGRHVANTRALKYTRDLIQKHANICWQASVILLWLSNSSDRCRGSRREPVELAHASAMRGLNRRGIGGLNLVKRGHIVMYRQMSQWRFVRSSHVNLIMFGA